MRGVEEREMTSAERKKFRVKTKKRRAERK